MFRRNISKKALSLIRMSIRAREDSLVTRCCYVAYCYEDYIILCFMIMDTLHTDRLSITE